MRTNDEIIMILSELKDQRNISLSELARRVGMAKSALSRYFNKTRDFPLNKVNEFAKALDVSPEYILGFEENSIKNKGINESPALYRDYRGDEEIEFFSYRFKPLTNENKRKVMNYTNRLFLEQEKVIELNQYKTIKIQSKLSAGTGIIDLDPEYAEEVQYNGDIPEHDLAFEVSGNSMEPIFENGEVIFVEKTQDIRNGQIIAVQINEESFIKKAYKEDNRLRLVSLNKKYDDIYATENDDIRIVGKVIL